MGGGPRQRKEFINVIYVTFTYIFNAYINYTVQYTYNDSGENIF